MVLSSAQVSHQPRSSVRLGGRPAAEIDLLQAAGIDVARVEPTPRYELAADVQERVDLAIEERAGTPGFVEWLFDATVHPSGAAWHGVAKRAVALHTLYHVGDLDRPAEGIDAAVYDEPLFERGTASARDIVRREHPGATGERILDRYDRFLAAGSMTDGEDEYGLTSRDYLTGVFDAHAVRSRGQVAKTLLHEHFPGSRHPLRLMSIACGAAGPIFDYARDAAADGVEIAELLVVDHDPLALASTVSLARGAGLGDRVTPMRKNLLKTPPIDYLDEQVDLVDLVGVFEHLPSSRLGYRIASHVLAGAAEAVRPGGLILLGNMLDERPQQRFFDSVWPRLQQRTMRQVLALALEAGIDAELVKVRVPAKDGIYALYALTVPWKRRRSVRERPTQRALGKALFAKLPEF